MGDKALRLRAPERAERGHRRSPMSRPMATAPGFVVLPRLSRDLPRLAIDHDRVATSRDLPATSPRPSCAAAAASATESYTVGSDPAFWSNPVSFPADMQTVVVGTKLIFPNLHLHFTEPTSRASRARRFVEYIEIRCAE